MPVSNIDANEVLTQANTERADEVRKELVKKYKVIAKRRGQIDNHKANFEAKVKAFEDQVNQATTPEQVMAALEAHKFPESSVELRVGR